MDMGELLHFPARTRDKVHAGSALLSILSVGRNREILVRREVLIRSRFDLVIRSLMPEEAEGEARGAKEYLWIFCSTVELPKLMSLAHTVRDANSKSRLILAQEKHRAGFEVALFHRVVAMSEGIEAFLDAVNALSIPS